MNGPAEASDRGVAARGRLARDLAILLAVCIAVFWIGLGRTGLSLSEGHRVLPAWEMLDRGEWLVPRLFGQAYLRKPPGMPWAVALSSAILGRTEFAARAVSAASASVTAFLAFAFARRWFGARWAIAAGLASALTPVFWPAGRSAEIEALHNAASMAAMLLILDLLVVARPGEHAGRRGARVVLLAGSIVAAGLAKGPASAPCLAGAVASACVVTRSLRPLARGGLWCALAAAAAGLGAIAWAIWRAARGSEPVLQGPGEFLWSADKLTVGSIARVLALGPQALVFALPATLGLLFAWRSRPSGAVPAPPHAADRGEPAARALGWTCLLSLSLLTVLGVDNPRYALPALTVVPLLAAPVACRAFGASAQAASRSARVAFLGRPVAWPVVLLAAAALYIGVIEPRRRASSGREAGAALAAALPDGAEVWADGLVEARPEVLHAARSASASAHRRVTLRWMPARGGPPRLPPPGGFVVLRTDSGLDEAGAVRRRGDADRLRAVAHGRVAQFAFTLYEVVR